MSPLFRIAMLAVVALGVLSDTTATAQTYQRSRGQYPTGGDKPDYGDKDRPYYRRHQQNYHRHNHFHRAPRVPEISSGQFQRPYPYHLDYYKMRWGGSYDPYFGNLYGPPNVVLGFPGVYGGGFNGGGLYNGGFSPAPGIPVQSVPPPMP